MKVKTLKEVLSQYDDSDIVILQKDSEGNGYSPLSEIYEGRYRAITTWYGEVGIKELTPELIKQGYSQEDLKPGGRNAIIFVPVN